MAKIALPYTIVNGDPVDAGPVESNYQTIENHANQELIERGGSVAMTAQLKLVGNPVAALDAAPKQYVDQVVPIGGILLYGGTVAPPGGVWLLCDGTEYQAATYPALASVIGATAGRFNVPALVDRLPVGGGGAYAHKSTGGRADAIVPLHTHPIPHDHGGQVSGNANQAHTHAGADHAHGININSNTVNTDHYHGVPLSGGRGFVVAAGVDGDQGPANIPIGGPGYTVQSVVTNVLGNGAAASHAHNISGGTALADRGPTTSGDQQVHNHNVSVPAFNGASGQAAGGLDPAGQNLPPYFALAFIIRAL